MGEIKHDNDLVILCRLLSDHTLEILQIKMGHVVVIGFVFSKPGTITDTENHIVVAPYHIRHDNNIVGIYPHVRQD